jgi:hypothetical protein
VKTCKRSIGDRRRTIRRGTCAGGPHPTRTSVRRTPAWPQRSGDSRTRRLRRSPDGASSSGWYGRGRCRRDSSMSDHLDGTWGHRAPALCSGFGGSEKVPGWVIRGGGAGLAPDGDSKGRGVESGTGPCSRHAGVEAVGRSGGDASNAQAYSPLWMRGVGVFLSHLGRRESAMFEDAAEHHLKGLLARRPPSQVVD